MPIPKNASTEALEALCVTLNFINCWIKQFDHNYEVRFGMYNKAMRKMFQKIATIKSKSLNQGKKLQKLLT